MNRTLVVAACLIAGARLASAQTHQETGIFIQGGGFADIERQSHYETDQLTSVSPIGSILRPEDAGGTTGGGTVGLGVFLRPFLSARTEISFAGERNSSFSWPGSVFTSGFNDALTTITSTQSADQRSKSADIHVLLAYHLPSSRRLRVALLGGVGFVHERTHTVVETTYAVTAPPLPQIPNFRPTVPSAQRDEYTFISYRRDVVIGIDGELALGDRVAMIPQLRLVGGAGSTHFRPGMSLRWRP